MAKASTNPLKKQIKTPTLNPIQHQDMDFNNIGHCIIGLGYVGLPLAVEFGKKYKTLGFDVNADRTEELKQDRQGRSMI